MTNKQKKTLQIIEYFIPDRVKDWGSPHIKNDLGLSNLEESTNGISPEAAFFQKTERGKLPLKVTNLGRLAALLSGQRWMAWQITDWKNGFRDGYHDLRNFVNEPPVIQEIAQGCYLSVFKKI